MRIYSDRTYTHTTMVRHQGTALAFAMDDKRRILYTVLDLSTHDEKRGELDAAYWSENPAELPFPDEIVKTGYALVGATAMPVVKKGGRAEAGAGEELEPQETDRFLSTTARLSAAAPFQVLSDGTHVVVLRQAVGAAHVDAVFALAGGGSSGDASRTDYVMTGAVKVPVVADTLLCDRFLLVGGRLKPVTEVRFRRSRHKSEPASGKDSLGASDMDGNPFHEPTKELAFIRNLTQGRFAAVLTPMAVQGQQRWQFFAHNHATSRIDSFNVEQAEDGLFNIQGSRYWTSPDAKYRSSVFEREPGTCPFTGLALVPVAPENRLAETALDFNGTSATVDLGAAAGLKFQGKAYAVEAWIKPRAAGGPVLSRWTAAGQGGFRLRITNTGQVILDHSGGSLTATRTVQPDAYTHVAASYDGTNATLYINGADAGRAALAYPGDGTATLRIGSAQGGGFFSGAIDEVRVWNRPRGQREIAVELGHRLIGNEPGLSAYYRLDEGAGTTVYDQSDTAAHGTLTGAAWVTSGAPVGDHPGVRRDSFTVAGRDVVSGLSAALYYQQEETVSGYQESEQPAKRQARVLLAYATRPTGNTTADAHIATVDFGIGVDGRLAAVPDVLALADVGRPVEETADKVTAQERKISLLEQEEVSIAAEIVSLTTEKTTLQQAIAASEAAAQTDPTRWNIRLQQMGNGNLYWISSGNTAGSALSFAWEKYLWRFVRCEGYNRHNNAGYVLQNPQTQMTMGIRDGNANNKDLVLGNFGTVNPPQHTVWYVVGDMTYSVMLENALTNVSLSSLGYLRNWYSPSDPLPAQFWVIKDSIAPDPALQPKVDRLAVVIALLDQRPRNLAAKQAETVLAREELARLTGGLLGAADLVLPVPHIGIDSGGLSSAGAVLKFARTASTPFLMDSAAGRLALYFQGANSQFFAAYLDTTAVRGVQQLTGNGLTALFTARDPGVDLTGTRIQITDCRIDNTAVPDLCNLTITRGTDTESFVQLPRRARDLAAVLNGVPDEPVQVGTVASVSGDQVRLTQASPRTVAARSTLQIDGTPYRVIADAAAGATTVRVTPAPPTGLAAGAQVSLVRYDTEGATASRPGASLDTGSQWVTVSADKGDLLVPNGSATQRVTGYGSRWRGDSPGRAFTFNGTAHRLSLPAAQLDQTTVTGDLTAEAWINPRRIPSASARSRILHAKRGDTGAALALTGAPVGGGMTLNRHEIVIDPWNPLAGDFTIECWLKRTTGRTVDDPIVAIADNVLVMGFTADGKFRFHLTSASGAETLTTPSAYTDGDWHHWAVTFDRTTRTQIILRDGVEVARRTAGAVPQQRVNVAVGRDTSSPYKFFSGSVAELRGWSTARSAADINADRNRRITTSEPGLVGSWSWDPTQTGKFKLVDISGRGLHGWCLDASLPAAVDSPLAGYRVVAAVGDKARTSRDMYLCGDWAHVAAVHEQSWALRFDGSAWAETPDADALDITGDLTLEVFASIDATGTRQGLVSKGRLGDGQGGSVPYQFSIRADGKLEFAFEEPGPLVKRFASTSAVTAGFHRLAVVRRAGRATEEIKGTRQITYTDNAGATQTKNVDVVERIDAKAWDDIRFVVDGTETGTSRYTGPGPRGNDGPLEIGRAQDGTTPYPLKGTIGEIRIWGKARDTNQLGTPLQPRDEGLLARWTFEENEGNTTADTAGGYDLKLRRARWTTDPNPAASAFTVYRNGLPIACDTPATNPLADWGDDQLTLGALKKAGTYSEFFDGTLEEVRYWRTARTPEQLLDSLFTRLKGDKQDVIGYWPFDSESTTTTAEAVRDQGLRGNHLELATDTTLRPAIGLSTAPVSTDTAAVRSALAGVRTPFHQNISTPPAATEYADLQYTRSGEAQGVLKRSYTHISDGYWHLTTGYKVGDLISEWAGQVQFDPQLIGYIEGAPPVPSENLTGGTDPTGCSKVTFQQAEEVTSTLSSTRERSVDMAFNLSAGQEIDADVLLILAPLGIGTAKPAVDVYFSSQIGTSLEFSNAWSSETAVSQGTSTARDTSATLTGAWEDPAKPLNAAIGRRFVPANQGYALVQSETADVYALRLAHSGALVAYRILPNPDIPKDWNIISFPLNPQYTKQGTLDGAVGFNDQGKVPDPAYPNASQYGEYSYFKPREAYAIKRRILRERQQLEDYYTNVSTETRDTDPTADRAAKVVESFVGPTSAAPKNIQPAQSASSFANRNIANTYVWTADGGFFAETTETTDVVTETTGGTYTFSNAVTTSLEASFEVFGIGIGLQMDGSLGGGLTRTRQRSKESTRSHSLEVECNPTRDLQKYQDGQPKYDTVGKPVLVPGKVDAYRFMTFYLGQDSTHFDDFYNKVADPTWLANSTTPSASALRQARQTTRKPPCWRVLHRVTYVSRILPPVPPAGAPPLEGSLRSVDIASNYELIRRLDPYVSTANTSRAELADATREALTTHLPQLLPHQATISQFLADYYGITD